MSKVIICCGKICSGKTTFCSKLEKEHGVFLFNADEWMIHFFGEAPDCSVFHIQLDKCVGMIYSIADRLLERGISVAFDFGFWTEKDRQDCVQRFSHKNAEIRIVYFPISDEKQIEYMNKRQNNKNVNNFVFNEEKLRFFNAKFEEPNDKKMVLIDDFIF